MWSQLVNRGDDWEPCVSMLPGGCHVLLRRVKSRRALSAGSCCLYLTSQALADRLNTFVLIVLLRFFQLGNAAGSCWRLFVAVPSSQLATVRTRGPVRLNPRWSRFRARSALAGHHLDVTRAQEASGLGGLLVNGATRRCSKVLLGDDLMATLRRDLYSSKTCKRLLYCAIKDCSTAGGSTREE